MDWTNALSFVMVALPLVMSPGPNAALIAKTVPTSGRRAGCANVAGCVMAFYFHGSLSILGISAILMASPHAFFIVKMLGAAYLCWIGVKALREASRGRSTAKIVEPSKRKRTLRSAFAEGVLTSLLNPKSSMFYLAAFPHFITTGDGAVASAFMLVILHSLIAATWYSTMVFLFARLVSLGQNGPFQRWFKGGTGAVFVGFGLKLATYRP